MFDATVITEGHLRRQFDFIQQSICDGVKGVWNIDSGKSGPTLGVTIHTHGNEPSGLSFLFYKYFGLSVASKNDQEII